MDPSHAPFLAAIRADVDSDAPRLKYADFLDETGEPHHEARAEFIRLQCALEGMTDFEPQYAELYRREKELLQLYWREWFEPVRAALGMPAFRRKGLFGGWVRREVFKLLEVNERRYEIALVTIDMVDLGELIFHFRRGFIEKLDFWCTLESQKRFDFDELFRCTPLRRITLGEQVESLQRLLRANQCGQLRSILLYPHFPGHSIRCLAETPESISIRELSIFYMTTREGPELVNPVPSLVNSVFLTGVRQLDLTVATRANCDLSPLIGSSLLRSLEVLEIRSPNVTQEFLFDLLLPGVAPNLRELRVNLLETPGETLVQLMEERFGEAFQLHCR